MIGKIRRRVKKSLFDGPPGGQSTLRLPSGTQRESALVQAILAADKQPHSPVSQAARDSFPDIHQQLMDAIERDETERAAQDFCARSQSGSTPFLVPALGWRSFARGLAPMRWALAALLLLAVGLGGHRLGRQQGAPALPIDTFVSDFDEDIKSEMPLDFISYNEQDATGAAAWLSRHTGQNVKLPSPRKSGARILGARHRKLWTHPVAQAHYIRNGVRLALFQVHAPRCGVTGLQETSVGGRTFLIAQRGAYHVVVWRKGDNIVTLVSPLARPQSLRLAAAMREDDPVA
jgi:hypothetical protein